MPCGHFAALHRAGESMVTARETFFRQQHSLDAEPFGGNAFAWPRKVVFSSRAAV